MNNDESERDMADTQDARSTSTQLRPGATHEEQLTTQLPPQERQQPDPVLQLSVGRLGAGAVTLAAVIAAIILGVVFYGLNDPIPTAQHTGAATTASSAPAAGGKGGPAAPGGQQTGNTGHS